MCNQCSNDGNPLCETCLVEERLTRECQRLAARVAGLEAVLRSIEWGGKCGELFVVEICPACGGSVEHEQGCALNAAKGAEHE